jgi:hypothetical protein
LGNIFNNHNLKLETLKRILLTLIATLVVLASSFAQGPIKPYNNKGYKLKDFINFSLNGTPLGDSYQAYMLSKVNDFLEETGLVDKYGRQYGQQGIYWIFNSKRAWPEYRHYNSGYNNTQQSADGRSVDPFVDDKGDFDGSVMVLHLDGYQLDLGKLVCINGVDRPYTYVQPLQPIVKTKYIRIHDTVTVEKQQRNYDVEEEKQQQQNTDESVVTDFKVTRKINWKTVGWIGGPIVVGGLVYVLWPGSDEPSGKPVNVPTSGDDGGPVNVPTHHLMGDHLPSSPVASSGTSDYAKAATVLSAGKTVANSNSFQWAMRNLKDLQNIAASRRYCSALQSQFTITAKVSVAGIYSFAQKTFGQKKLSLRL